jgi:hypothetical protein
MAGKLGTTIHIAVDRIAKNQKLENEFKDMIKIIK